jgi:hypothetical protein
MKFFVQAHSFVVCSHKQILKVIEKGFEVCIAKTIFKTNIKALAKNEGEKFDKV